MELDGVGYQLCQVVTSEFQFSEQPEWDYYELGFTPRKIILKIGGERIWINSTIYGLGRRPTMGFSWVSSIGPVWHLRQVWCIW